MLLKNEKENNPNPNPKLKEIQEKCTIPAIDYLFIIMRDTDIKNKVDIKKLKEEWDSGKKTSGELFQIALANCDNEDVKKDIKVYEHHSNTCEWKDFNE